MHRDKWKGEGTLEEIELVKLLKGGNKSAFDELYERYKDITLRMAYMICGNLADSEDIVQETFIKCYQHIGELKNEEQFKSWLFHILTRTAWRYGKKQSKELPKEGIEVYLENQKEASSLELILLKERDASLFKLINKLSIKHRTTLVLYYYNELSTKEIAKILGCLEGTVKSRLFIARKLLKESILKEARKEVLLHEKWS